MVAAALIARPRGRQAAAAAVEVSRPLDQEKPSKSARKRENLALQALGESLTRLRPPEIDALPLDERLKQAVIDARNMQSRGALRRQRQLIGKLMRSADVAAILAAVTRLGQADRQAAQLFRDAEHWRDRICAGGRDAVADFATHTGSQTQLLVSLVSELAEAEDENRRRGARRRIFKAVHDVLAASPRPVRQR